MIQNYLEALYRYAYESATKCIRSPYGTVLQLSSTRVLHQFTDWGLLNGEIFAESYKDQRSCALVGTWRQKDACARSCIDGLNERLDSRARSHQSSVFSIEPVALDTYKNAHDYILTANVLLTELQT